MRSIVFMPAILAEGVGRLRSNPQKSCVCPKVADLTNVVTGCEFPANVKNEFLRAIDLALSGEWDAAHQIVQQYEDTTAAGNGGRKVRRVAVQ